MKLNMWWLPFIFFIIGYYAAMRLVPLHEVVVPQVVGHPLQDALMMLSSVHLSGRIIAEREDPLVPPGVVLCQYPEGAMFIKLRSAIDLVVSKKRSVCVAPSYYGRPHDAVHGDAERQGIRLREHWIEHSGVRGTVIAQYPIPGEELTDKVMHVYVVAGQDFLCIMPSLIGQSLHDAEALLDRKGFEVRIRGKSTSWSEDVLCSVIDQKPHPGAVIDMRLKNIAYLMVSGQMAS